MRGSEAGSDTGAMTRAERLRIEAIERIEAGRLEQSAPPAPPEPVELRGSWVQVSPSRRRALAVLVLALAGVLTGLVMLFTVQTFAALAALVGSTVVALLAYTAISVTAPTRVTLEESVLTVRCGRDTDTFDFAGRIRRVAVVGIPNRPNWRIQLMTEDGKIVELGPTQVDPELVHALIERYRTPTRTTSSVPQQRTGA